jgi:hypothetical protein
MSPSTDLPEFVSGWDARALQAEVLAEHAHGQELTAKQFEWFASRGVTAATLTRPFPILRDDVVLLPGGRFEFARYGKGESVVSALTCEASRGTFETAVNAGNTPGSVSDPAWCSLGNSYEAAFLMGLRPHPISRITSNRR